MERDRMARPKLGDSETERLHVKITAAEIKAIDDWRYANRVPSRSEAVRRLVQIGLTLDAQSDSLATDMLGLSERIGEAGRDLVDLSIDTPEDHQWMATRAFAHLAQISAGYHEMVRSTVSTFRRAKAFRGSGEIEAIIQEQKQLAADLNRAALRLRVRDGEEGLRIEEEGDKP
jgi:hypothetical protein